MVPKLPLNLYEFTFNTHLHLDKIHVTSEPSSQSAPSPLLRLLRPEPPSTPTAGNPGIGVGTKVAAV